MVHLPTKIKMNEYYQKHLQEYFKEHPGEYVLIERGNFFDFKVSFFEDRSDLEKAISAYAGLIGPTVFTEKIPPSNTHRFNKNNHTFYFPNKYIKYCPNDKKREMPLTKKSQVTGTKLNRGHIEYIRCKDCGCLIERKPSKEAIKKWEKEMKNFRIGGSLSRSTQSNKKDLADLLKENEVRNGINS